MAGDASISARSLALKAGFICGASFVLVGIIFVAISVFTGLSRSTWLILNQAKGFLGFGFCGITGMWLRRRGCTHSEAALAGALAGFCAGVLIPVAIYTLPYLFIHYVVQYPFEYYDYLSSGAPSARAFLLSSDGRATVTSTSLGLIPVVAIWASLQGALLAGLGAWMAGRFRTGTTSPRALSSTLLR